MRSRTVSLPPGVLALDLVGAAHPAGQLLTAAQLVDLRPASRAPGSVTSW